MNEQLAEGLAVDDLHDQLDFFRGDDGQPACFLSRPCTAVYRRHHAFLIQLPRRPWHRGRE